MRYLITFACYGARLHGEELGSVDRHHNVPGRRLVEAEPGRVATERRAMTHAAYLLDERERPVVLEALQEVSLYRKWTLIGAHVRTNHVHVIVEADVRPEKVLNDFKAYASRRLNRQGRGGRVGSAGRITGVRDGCGRIRTFGMPFDMLSRNRVSPWLSLWRKICELVSHRSVTVAAQ